MRPKDYIEAGRKLRELRKSGKFVEQVGEHTGRKVQPWFSYQRIEPRGDEHLVSLHNHSDGQNYSLGQMAVVAERRGYKFFCVTDHNVDLKFKGKRVIYNSTGGGIYLIKGMECRCEDNGSGRKDILLLGYKGCIKPFCPMEETAKRCKEQGGLVIATTPLNERAKGLSRSQIERIAGNVDAIEVFNSGSGFGNLCYYDIMAEQLAEELKIPGVAVNDAHTLREIGLAGIKVTRTDFTFLKDPREVEEHPEILLEALKTCLKNRQFTNYGSYIPLGSVMPPFMLAYPDKLTTLSHKHAVLRPG